MKYKAVVFDMDGVIFDSERAVLECWKEVTQKQGLRDIGLVFEKCIGTSAAATRQIFLEYYGQDVPYEEFRKESSRIYHEKYDNGRLPMKPGVVEILSFLSETGWLVGLASSTREAVVRQEIGDAGLLPYFRNLTCGDMLKKSKPEPDIFLMACGSLGVKPEEAIAVEDSCNGIRAAYRAGMMPVMVPDMVKPDDEMRKLAGKICGSLLEVMEWIKTI